MWKHWYIEEKAITGDHGDRNWNLNSNISNIQQEPAVYKRSNTSTQENRILNEKPQHPTASSSILQPSQVSTLDMQHSFESSVQQPNSGIILKQPDSASQHSTTHAPSCSFIQQHDSQFASTQSDYYRYGDQSDAWQWMDQPIDLTLKEPVPDERTLDDENFLSHSPDFRFDIKDILPQNVYDFKNMLSKGTDIKDEITSNELDTLDMFPLEAVEAKDLLVSKTSRCLDFSVRLGEGENNLNRKENIIDINQNIIDSKMKEEPIVTVGTPIELQPEDTRINQSAANWATIRKPTPVYGKATIKSLDDCNFEIVNVSPKHFSVGNRETAFEFIHSKNSERRSVVPCLEDNKALDLVFSPKINLTESSVCGVMNSKNRDLTMESSGKQIETHIINLKTSNDSGCNDVAKSSSSLIGDKFERLGQLETDFPSEYKYKSEFKRKYDSIKENIFEHKFVKSDPFVPCKPLNQEKRVLQEQDFNICSNGYSLSGDETPPLIVDEDASRSSETISKTDHSSPSCNLKSQSYEVLNQQFDQSDELSVSHQMEQSNLELQNPIESNLDLNNQSVEVFHQQLNQTKEVSKFSQMDQSNLEFQRSDNSLLVSELQETNHTNCVSNMCEDNRDENNNKTKVKSVWQIDKHDGNGISSRSNIYKPKIHLIKKFQCDQIESGNRDDYTDINIGSSYFGFKSKPYGLAKDESKSRHEPEKSFGKKHEPASMATQHKIIKYVPARFRKERKSNRRTKTSSSKPYKCKRRRRNTKSNQIQILPASTASDGMKSKSRHYSGSSDVMETQHPLNTSLSSESDFTTHVTPEELESCEEFFWCHICEKSIKTEAESIKHQSGHCKKTMVNLNLYYLTVYGNMTKHWKGYNKEDKCVFLCGLCETTVPYAYGFKRHVQCHGNGYKCDVCERSFRSEDSLYEHHITHTGEKPFQCSDCGEKYSNKNSLYSHRQVHSTKPRKCEFCGRLMSSKGSLTVHRRLHTGENPYHCRLCEKSYPQNVQLKLHMKTHRRNGDV